MKTTLLAAAVAVALVSGAPVANAAKVLTLTPPAADGSFSGVFSDTGLGAGAFSDTFTFTMPTGIAAATISSIFTSAMTNVDFTTVTLDGTAFTIASTGVFESRFLNGLPVTNGTQTLVVAGTSGGEGSFAGTLSFTPASVPEPFSWAMMIVGFGGIGAVMRRRRLTAMSAVLA